CNPPAALTEQRPRSRRRSTATSARPISSWPVARGLASPSSEPPLRDDRTITPESICHTGGQVGDQPCRISLCVLRTDNKPRVRGGYIRSGTRGHARAPETPLHPSICR